MDWLLCEDILMRNWISVLEGGYRPKADISRASLPGKHHGRNSYIDVGTLAAWSRRCYLDCSALGRRLTPV